MNGKCLSRHGGHFNVEAPLARPPPPTDLELADGVTSQEPPSRGDGSRDGRFPVAGELLRLLPAPRGDAGVVARDEYVRNGESPPLQGLGEHRVFEQPVELRRVRLFDERLGVPNHTGQEPYDRRDDRERRDLSPVEGERSRRSRSSSRSYGSCPVW